MAHEWSKRRKSFIVGVTTLIDGTITATLTFDPAIDFEQAKDRAQR
jgi:hypothetical protein